MLRANKVVKNRNAFKRGLDGIKMMEYVLGDSSKSRQTERKYGES